MKTAHLLSFVLVLLLFLVHGCGGVHKSDYTRLYKWDKSPVTYRIIPAGNTQGIDLSLIPTVPVPDKYRADFQDAVSDWHNAGGPEFVPAPDGVVADVDVVAQTDAGFEVSRAETPPDHQRDYVTFYEENERETPPDHKSDDHATRATGDTLAVAELYAPGGIIQRAVVRFRVGMSGAQGTRVVLHEAGHLCGLSHSAKPLDVMYPIATGIAEKITGGLTSNDKRRVRELYEN